MWVAINDLTDAEQLAYLSRSTIPPRAVTAKPVSVSPAPTSIVDGVKIPVFAIKEPAAAPVERPVRRRRWYWNARGSSRRVIEAVPILQCRSQERVVHPRSREREGRPD
ncbi:MAG: hypothetical protein MZU97_13480 [Bacillus subtilis]|nr:hypothetical protein [Bacillus subtilis]